jgi:hypothetical protein
MLENLWQYHDESFVAELAPCEMLAASPCDAHDERSFFVFSYKKSGQKLLLHEKFLELLWSLSIAFTVFAVSHDCDGRIRR